MSEDTRCTLLGGNGKDCSACLQKIEADRINQPVKRLEWDADEIASGAHPFKWSLMTDTDRATLRNTVETMCDSISISGVPNCAFCGCPPHLDSSGHSFRPREPALNFLEIGTYNGSTAWGVKAVTEGKGKKLNYWGVDLMTHDAVLFPGANMIIGDSTKIFYTIPDLPFDILFIDGAHNSGNCMLDFLNFAPKLRVGGLILFHDASPASQCQLPFTPEKEAEYEKGGFEIPIHHEFGTAVLVALKKLGMSDGSRTDYELVANNWSDEPWGGISIFRKVR